MGFFDNAGQPIVVGDCTLPNWEGYIELLAWSWGSSFNPVNPREIIVTKSFDSASVPLVQKAVTVEVMSQGGVYLVDPSSTGDQLVQKIELANTTVQLVEMASGTALTTEERLTLRFNSITLFGPDRNYMATINQPGVT
jgi:type VI protein secretion system component Hcp